ncbi:hypothetical protein ACQEVM_33055 [Streptomyces sp. CA-243310]|uniref:hypothetical protein n=1 Tax=Streptomyces sp. CA-243310 TaxID=3240056 RepID=UPI003D94455D
MTPEQFMETHAEALDKRLQAHKVSLIRMQDEEKAAGRTEAVRVLGAEIDSVNEIQNDLGQITRAESVK